MIYFGIDTGKNTGVAVWNSATKSLEVVECLLIHQAMERVRNEAHFYMSQGMDVMVLFEDARKRKWFGKDSYAKQQGAGSIKRDAVIWEDALRDWGIPFQPVAPGKGATKWTAEQFRRATGWRGRTNEHSRDAALIVYGR